MERPLLKATESKTIRQTLSHFRSSIRIPVSTNFSVVENTTATWSIEVQATADRLVFEQVISPSVAFKLMLVGLGKAGFGGNGPALPLTN